MPQLGTNDALSRSDSLPSKEGFFDKKIPASLLLSVSAICVSLMALGWSVFHDPLGSGIKQYDFTTPKAALTSYLTIGQGRDLRAAYELAMIGTCRQIQEKLKTLTVSHEAEWRGKKILFVKYQEGGVPKYDTEAFEKDVETGMWFPSRTYELERVIRHLGSATDPVDPEEAALGKMIEKWKKGVADW